MMAHQEANYSAVANDSNPFVVKMLPNANDDEETTEDDFRDTDDEAPRDSGLMIHVVPDTSKARWNHIEDLDSFFTRMYNYHQKHGFAVMMLQEVFELGQFIFVVGFVTFLFHCVNYPVLFGDTKTDITKITISDSVYTCSECVSSISGWSWLVLTLAILFWVFRLIKVVYHSVQYWDVKKFYNTALKIDDCDLDNLTWHEVQQKIRDVQSEQQMCIHKQQLTELDIYHRILRFKNYMVAMMNKSLIPSKVCLPLLGESVIFSRGLRYNIELILFRGPWSPFENNWHLKEEFKRGNKRIELAQKLSRQIAWIALAHFLLSPLIFLWAMMMFFFSYADLIKREPGTLGTRCWSQYGMLYMRHFNELDHELHARLNRAYRPAVKYMNTFSSPLMAVIAGNVVFICGGVLSVLIILTIYDEDVLQVEHVFTVISCLTAIVVISRVFIPDENLIWCPEQLMTAVLAHTHYLPVSWRGLAHTNRVRDQFDQFFQFRFTYLLNELLSPLTTPYMLMFHFRPRSLELVDFFRNFTVSVVGVGDVCSFAQMDVRKHGNPDWQPTRSTTGAVPEHVTPVCETNQYTQGEHGKTELSLVHFTLTNPGWKMPVESKQFVHGLRRHAIHDMDPQRVVGAQTNAGAATTTTAMEQSLYCVNSMGGEYSSIVQSVMNNQRMFNNAQLQSSSQCSYGIRNPFSPSASLPPDVPYNHSIIHHNAQAAPSSTFDFQHMLNQNMSMEAPTTSVQRSTILDSISENAEDDHGHRATSMPRTSFVDRTNQSMLGASMGASIKGGLSRREGPPDGSQEGLLHSVFHADNTIDAAHPTELTAADMCLSTLYLHELHHRQIRRRGAPLDQRCRQQWQRPHQQMASSQQQPQSPSGPISSVGSGQQQSYAAGIASTSVSSSSAVENTPLLGAKKS